jgi:hypothetical protein
MTSLESQPYVKSSRLITYIFLPVLFSLIISAIVNLQLFQDGSSYLFELLVTHSAVRHDRLSVFILQSPTILIDKVFIKWHIDPNDYLRILRLTFSLNYALIPFISLILSWFVVRRKNESLFIWAALVILFINLVNFSWVSELLIALQLSCSLLLVSILRPGTKFFWVLTIILLPIIFFLHPLVLLLFVTIAIGTAFVSYRKVESRKVTRLSAIIFLIAAILRGILNLFVLDPYETSFLESGEMNNYFFVTSLENEIFLIVALVIGVICLLTKLVSKKNISLSGKLYICGMSLAVAAACLLLSQYFSGAGEFPLKTGLALFASIVIMFMACIDILGEISFIERTHRFRLVTTLSVIFSLVIISKSWIWQTSTRKLEQSLLRADSQCIELVSKEFLWLEKNPYNIINNWSLPSLALVMQDNHPRKLLLEKDSCKIFHESGMVQLDPWTNLPKELIIPPLN